MTENKKRSNVFFEKTAEKIIRFRWLVLLLLTVVTVFFVSNMKNLTFDNSADIWFVEGDESVTVMKKFEEAFGNDDFVSLFVKADKNGKFTPEMLKLMRSMALELEEKVPLVKRMQWLGNAEWIESTPQGLEISSFISNEALNQKQVDALLDKSLTEPSYVNALINKDKTLIPIHLELYEYPEQTKEVNSRYEITEAVYSIVKNERYKELEVLVTSPPVFSYEYDRMVSSEGKKLFMMTIVIMLTLMAWLGRGVRGVFAPIAVVALSVFWTMGAIPYMGFTINLLTTALPTILICVGIADSMHYISAFNDFNDDGLERRESLIKGLGVTGVAIVLTSMTTIAGFLSFLTTHIKPYREMGVYVAAGVFFAMIITMLLVPSIFSFGKKKINPKKTRRHGGQDIFDIILVKIHSMVVNHPVKILTFFIIITVAAIIGASFVKVESNTAKLIKKGNHLRDITDYIGDKMGGVMSLEFMIDTGRENGIKSAEFMKKLDEFHLRLEAHPLSSKVTSITYVLKKMRKALHDNDMEFYHIPDEDKAVSQYLFMYETSGGNEMDRLVTFMSDKARVIVKLPSLSTMEGRKFGDFAVKTADEIFGSEVTLAMSGGLYRYLRINDILLEGQRNSFLAALIAIGIMMMFVMRSAKLGFLSMIPNVFPVVISLGLLGFCGVYLDVILMSFAPIIIGVSVDDTIHFFTRFRNEFNRCGNYSDALFKTYTTVGRPIIFTSMILVLGFAPFIFSELTGYIKNGFLMGWAFSWALLADFFMAPAAIMLIKPLGKETGENK